MTKKATMAAIAALLALSGCERLGIGTGNANIASGNDSGSKDIPAANQQAAADPLATGGKDIGSGAVPAVSNDGGAVVLSRAYVVGRWTDSGNCDEGVDLANDGSFTAVNDTHGLWNLQDDRLTMTGSTGDRTISFRVIPVDQNTMSVVNQDGSIGRSTRC